MKKLFTLFLGGFLFIANSSSAQNLVLNPSFENFTVCPMGPSEFLNTIDWTIPFNNIIGDTCSTSDLYNTCSPLGCFGVGVPCNILGDQPAHTGDGYAGIILYEGFSLIGCNVLFGSGWREYVQAEFSTPLVAGQTYQVSFYASLADNVKFATGDFGVRISPTPISVNCTSVGGSSALQPLGYTPQLTWTGGAVVDILGWTLLSWNYVATGGEQYLVIGNFLDDASTTYTCVNGNNFNPYAYYYIDDVEVVEASLNQPAALFSAPNNVCPGTCTNFTNLSTNATSYAWSFNGGNPSVSTDTDPANICYNTPGTYDVTLIATGAAGTDTLTMPNYITVFAYPAPQGIMQSGDTLFANAGAVSYQWYYDGILIPGATDNYYVALQNGNYNVIATDANGCEVEAVIFDVVSAVHSLTAAFAELVISPNPAQDQLVVDGLPASGDISVYNPLGERVYHSAIHGVQKIVNCQEFASGLYILEVTYHAAGKNDASVYRSKFMKE